MKNWWGNLKEPIPEELTFSIDWFIKSSKTRKLSKLFVCGLIMNRASWYNRHLNRIAAPAFSGSQLERMLPHSLFPVMPQTVKHETVTVQLYCFL